MPDDLKRYLIIGLIALISIILIFIIFNVLSKKKEKTTFPELLEALGGAENISNITLNGSRISMNFESKKDMDKDKIKENGVETIVVSNKKITLVIGKKASPIYKYLKEVK